MLSLRGVFSDSTTGWRSFVSGGSSNLFPHSEVFPVIVVAPSGKILPEVQDFMHKIQARGAEIIAISDSQEALSLARTPLALPRTVPEWLSPATAIVPGQLLAMHLAHARDYDVDQPRGLRKVTETI